MATLGYTTVGGTGGGGVANQFEVAGPFTAASSGTLTDMTFSGASNAGTVHVTMGVYNDSAGSPGTLLATSAEITVNNTTPQLWTGAISGSIVSGQAYWIAISFDGGTVINHDGATPPPDGRHGTSTYSAGSLPGTPPSTSAFGGVLRTMYATYTAGSGSSAALSGSASTSAQTAPSTSRTIGL